MTYKVVIVNTSNWPEDDIEVDVKGGTRLLHPGDTIEFSDFDPTGGAFGVVLRRNEDITEAERGYKPWAVDVYRAPERGRDDPHSLMRWFAYEHLPEVLQPVSKACALLAERLDTMLPDGAEKTVGLRKLLEAKDALVRSAIAGGALDS